MKFHGLDQNLVYGVCYNGNMTEIAKDTQVVQAPFSAMEANREAERKWHERVGAEYDKPASGDNPC